MLNPAVEARSPRSFRRAIAGVALACGLMAAPATVMLANATHAAAEVTPPNCYDDPNGPGCSGGGGGGDNGGTGTGEAGGGKGGGHTGPAYRTFITDGEVDSIAQFGMGLNSYEPSQWRSYDDFVSAVKAYWDAHSTAAVCVSADAGCRFDFSIGATSGKHSLVEIYVSQVALP